MTDDQTNINMMILNEGIDTDGVAEPIGVLVGTGSGIGCSFEVLGGEYAEGIEGG